MRAAALVQSTTAHRRARKRLRLLVAAASVIGVLLALVPAAFADTGTPIAGSLQLTIVPLNGTPNGPVTVYAQGQWNWATHNTDCNADRAGAGVALIWNDPNEPGYSVSGPAPPPAPGGPPKPPGGGKLTYGVGVAKMLNGDTYNAIDGTVHPVDIGIEGGANSQPQQSGAAGQVIHDVAPVASGAQQDYKNWRGGCGREPLKGAPQYPGIPYGSWGYDPAINNGQGYSHTYMHLSDVTTVCFNMYDVHGGGNPGTKNFQVPAGSNEIDAGKAGDNSISAGQFDPVKLNCLTPGPDLAVTKTDGVDSVTAGGTTTYTVTVTNVGPQTATNQTVSDPVAAGVASQTWTAQAFNGASVSTAGGNNAVNAQVTVPAGGSVTFTITANVSPTATGTISNTASVTVASGETNTGNNSATDKDTVASQVDFAVTKDDGVLSVNAGGSTTYIVVVSNSGPSTASGAVTDPQPSDEIFSGWSTTTSGGASVVTGSGTGDINDGVTLPPGSSVTFTVTASVAASASGTVSNTAWVTVIGSTDTNVANNSASDKDTVVPAAPQGPDLAISKTDGTGFVVLAEGSSTVYTIVVTNSGPGSAGGATVTDTMPSNVTGMTWTATASGGATVEGGPTSSGTGSISSLVTVPVGGSVTYTVTVTGIFTTLDNSHLINTATVTEADDANTVNNTATDDDFVIGF